MATVPSRRVLEGPFGNNVQVVTAKVPYNKKTGIFKAIVLRNGSSRYL